MRFKISLLLVITALSIASCKKPVSQPDTKEEVDVYVVGNISNAALNKSQPMSWKNGVKTPFAETEGDAKDITTLNKDIYISGTGNLTAPLPRGYWKNGSFTAAAINTTSGRTAFTDGTDVYIGGGSDKYLKNGVSNSFTKFCRYYTVKDGHFYTLVQDAGNSKYNYYKDDVKVLTLEPNSGTGFIPEGIQVYNNDVYVVGNFIKQADLSQEAVYWKNGVLYSSSNDPSLKEMYVRNFIVNETGLHMVGLTGTGSMSAVYWHNNVQTKLPNLTAAPTSNPLNIFVYKNDVYICGSTNGQACYWKNGKLIILNESLPDNYVSRANGILVLPR